jgi:hypothetical protein
MINSSKNKEEIKEYYYNGALKCHYHKIDNKIEGEYKQYNNIEKYDNNRQLFFHHYLYSCHFYKNHKLEGKHKIYHQSGELDIYSFYKNNKREGKSKTFYREDVILFYYIDDKMITCKFNFEIEFALLKFKDILKSKVRKPVYEKLDKYFIKDISNIVGTYLFTMSNLNPNGKRILFNMSGKN